MVKALIIGCGNIGGLYDLENDSIQTHAKAISKNNWIEKVDVFDINIELQRKICEKYDFNGLKSKEKINFEKYNIVCINTPTDTHFEYLKLCLESKVRLIVCEKPISNSISELDDIMSLYISGESKIVVNYFRRFLNSYLHLRNEFFYKKQVFKEIHVKYYKGFLNNCGHALDTIEFLTETNMNPISIIMLRRDFDFFKDDPTITATFFSNDIKFKVEGSDLNHKTFEILFTCENQEILLKDSGNKIEISQNGVLNFESDDLIKNYMTDLYSEIENIYYDNKLSDNFHNSIMLNRKQILHFIRQIKNQQY